MCIGLGPDWTRAKTEFGASCGPRIGPDRSRAGLLLSNNAALQTCTKYLARSSCATRHGLGPSVFWARSIRAARHDRATSIREKTKKNLLKFGPQVRPIYPPVQPGIEPKIEFNKITNRTPDRRGPVRSEPVLSLVWSQTENCTGLSVTILLYSSPSPSKS